MKLYIKIAGLIAVIAVCIGLFDTFWSGANIKRVMVQDLQTRGVYLAKNIATSSAASIKNGDLAKLQSNLRHAAASEPNFTYAYIADNNGTIVARSFREGLSEEILKQNTPDSTTTQFAEKEAIVHVSQPIEGDSGYHLHIGLTSQPILQTVNAIRMRELLFAGFITLVGVLVGTFLVKRVTEPILSLAEQMRRYGRETEIPFQLPDVKSTSIEANVLYQAFKQMLEYRHAITQELIHREAEFEAMFNSMNDAVLFAGIDRNIRLYNPAFSELFGFGEKELLGKSTEAIYADPSDFKEQGKRRYRVGEGGDLATYYLRYRRSDGSIFYGETRGTQVKDANGATIGFIAIFRDVTDQKKRQEELNQFKNTLDNTLDCVFMFRPDTLKFFYVNKGATEQVGYSREELLQMTPVDIKEQYDESSFRELIRPLLDHSRKSITFETVHEHRDGHLVPVEIFLQYIDPPGETARFVAVVRDLTERKQAERVLNERHQLLSLVINSAPVIMWSVNREGVFTLSVGKGLEDIGLDPGQVVGASVMELYADNPKLIADVRRALAGESFTTYTHESGRYYESHYSPIRDSEGETVGAMGVAVDMTERLRAEQELRKHHDQLEVIVAQRTQELEAANKELESFSYSVSHDLRAPLRSIDGFSQILLEDHQKDLDKTAQDYLNRIRTAAQRMARLIDDLLQLSRVTRSELLLEPVNLSAMANAIVGELKSLEPGRNVHVRIAPKLRAKGDANLMQILLQNLLGNAWKYTNKKDEAHIEFGKRKLKGENVFYVKDNGAGFDMRYADKLFGPFQRLHGVDEFEGTGIGLASVQRVVRRHGGEVWAEAEPGKGAAFYFKLPESNNSY